MPSSLVHIQVVLAVISDSPVPDTDLDACGGAAVSGGERAAGAVPPDADQKLPAHADEPVSRPDRRITEVPTAAPMLGAVRDLPDATLGQAIGFRAPTVVLDGVAAAGYCVAAASLAGTAHLVAGSVRQDAYDFIATATGSLVVVVADGLGSKTTLPSGCPALLRGCPSRGRRRGGEHPIWIRTHVSRCRAC